MMRFLLACALLAFAAAPAHAYINLAWNDCYGQGTAAQSITFDCAAGGPYLLIGQFQTPAPIGNFVAMDIVIDMSFEGQTSVPAFWQFQSGGCNETGIQYSSDRSSAGTCMTGNSTPWGSTGGCGAALITGYQIGLHGPGSARLLATTANECSGPINLKGPPTQYFGFYLDFIMGNALESGGSCAGCSTPVDIVWNSARLYNCCAPNAPEATFDLTSTDPGSNPCVSVCPRPCRWSTVDTDAGYESRRTSAGSIRDAR